MGFVIVSVISRLNSLGLTIPSSKFNCRRHHAIISGINHFRTHIPKSTSNNGLSKFSGADFDRSTSKKGIVS